MGLLFLIVLGIGAMVLIAILANRSTRKGPLPQPPQNGRESVTIEKLAVYNVVELEALIKLLIAKGTITKGELLKEIEDIEGEKLEGEGREGG